MCIARILGKGIMKKSLWPRLNESQHSAGSIHLRVLTNRGVICVKLRVVEYCQRAREKLMLSFSLKEEREGSQELLMLFMLLLTKSYRMHAWNAEVKRFSKW